MCINYTSIKLLLKRSSVCSFTVSQGIMSGKGIIAIRILCPFHCCCLFGLHKNFSDFQVHPLFVQDLTTTQLATLESVTIRSLVQCLDFSPKSVHSISGLLLFQKSYVGILIFCLKCIEKKTMLFSYLIQQSKFQMKNNYRYSVRTTWSPSGWNTLIKSEVLWFYCFLNCLGSRVRKICT